MRDHIATPQETTAALLEKAQRQRSVPVRRTFVQGGKRGDPKPGPLAELVRRRDERGFDLFTLLLAAASAPLWNVYRPAQMWARALGLGDTTSSTAAISKIWKRLEADCLITRDRKGVLASVAPLREDGTGRPYEHPGKLNDPYFQVPLEFWTASDFWCRSLNLAEKAMLMIALSLSGHPKRDAGEFKLPMERVPDWYGISADTAGRGIGGLAKKRLLAFVSETKKAPLSAKGFTQERVYKLLPPFRTMASDRTNP